MAFKNEVAALKLVESASVIDKQKTELLAPLGDVSDLVILGDMVLVLVYVRPDKTKSGLYIPEVAQKEDEWQGKVGLVVKLGETAFKYRGAFNYEGQAAKVGDWVSFRTSDGWSLKVGNNKVMCRMVDCNDLRMILPNPDFVY